MKPPRYTDKRAPYHTAADSRAVGYLARRFDEARRKLGQSPASVVRIVKIKGAA